MNVDMAKRLADRRRQAGLTQEGLAEKLNVTRQAVSKWERSESSPDTDNLIALAELYNVSLDDLLYADIEGGSRSSEWSGDSGLRDEAASRTQPPDDSDAEMPSEDDGTPASEAPGTPDEPSGETEGEGHSFASPDGNVHIGPDGIHVEDGKDYVHINWHDGVNVVDGNKGEHVHVGWNGVHVNDEDYHDLWEAHRAWGRRHPEGRRSSGIGKAALRFPFPALVIIAYILAGIFAEAWGQGLFLFFTIPLYYLIAGLCTTKRLGLFLAGLYPLAVTAWFCWMAFICNNPHPAWVIFLTIPLAEWAIVAISHWWRQKKRAAGK